MVIKGKRKRDTNQLAKNIADIATGEVDPYDGKDPKLIERGREAGKKGGAARASKLTDKERSKIAKKAAQARWKDK